MQSQLVGMFSLQGRGLQVVSSIFLHLFGHTG